MFKLFSAVAHMHSKKIVHRDLKPENILFDNKKYSECEIKIIDFGLSKILDYPDASSKKLSFVGTPLYVAPEVVRNVEYGTSVDMWSLGVIMFIMLSGRQPFRGEDMNSVYGKIIKSDYKFEEEDWSEVSPEAQDLIRLLLEKDAKKRIDAKSALKHVWIKKFYLDQVNKGPRRKLSHSKTII
jgi:calcium-dependent protein kinase